MNKKRPSLAFLDIFWVLIPKIIVILAENQYLGRFAGYQGITIGWYRPSLSRYDPLREAAKIWIFSKNHYDFQTQHPKNCRKRQGPVSTAKKVSVGPPSICSWISNYSTKCCCKRLCFLGFCHFSKKIWVLAARLGARNFTRVLGYAKHPLSVAHAFADARFRRRTLSHTHAFADPRFRRRMLSQTHAFENVSFLRRKLS